MDNQTTPDFAEQVAAALDWWREAGVDQDFGDEPANWLARPDDPAAADETPAPIIAPAPVRAPLAPAAKGEHTIAGSPSEWPQDLNSFRQWWLTERTLDFGGTQPRVVSRGPEKPDLMVMVIEPELEDRESLLSGPQGKLLSSMLQAMGIGEERYYIASALPRHTPLADWAAIEQSGLGAVLLHHVALVQPKRLLICGRGILPLFGHDPAQKPAALQQVQHEAGSTAAMAAFGLGTLLARPAARAGFWQRWLDWTNETVQ